jgi:rhodanese-related sulfurtransferase
MVREVSSFQNLQVSDLRQWIEAGKAFQLVDVRSESEYAAGHIPNAVLIPLEQVPSRANELATDRPVVIVCRSGHRSQIACQIVESLGRDLFNLEGGTMAWMAAKLPVDREGGPGFSVQRQVQSIVGLAVVGSSIAILNGATGWSYMTLFMGAGLLMAGLTEICPLGMMLVYAPWNRRKA